MSRSKVKGQGHKGQKTKNCWVISIDNALRREPYTAWAVRCTKHAATDDTIACRPGVTGCAGGKISACCLVTWCRRHQKKLTANLLLLLQFVLLVHCESVQKGGHYAVDRTFQNAGYSFQNSSNGRLSSKSTIITELYYYYHQPLFAN